MDTLPLDADGQLSFIQLMRLGRPVVLVIWGLHRQWGISHDLAMKTGDFIGSWGWNRMEWI